MTKSEIIVVTIEPLSIEFACCLAVLLNTDSVLQKELSIPTNHVMTGKEVLLDIEAWNTQNNSLAFVILCDNQVTGLISLSHINRDKRKARIGYWIGSQYRRKGITTEAFSLLLRYAHNIGIELLGSKINKDNIASLRIWEKRNANFSPSNNFLIATILLSDRSDNTE